MTPELDYESTESYKSALAYFRAFEKKEEVKYDWVIKYAKELHERMEKTDKQLDEKADSIVKYLGGGSALVTFGALASIKPDRPETSLFGLVALVALLPSLCCAIWAVRAAIKARRPRSTATMPSICKAITLAENYQTPEEAELNLTILYHPICEAYVEKVVRKAEYVHTSHKFYSYSLSLLLVPVLALCVFLGWQATKPVPPSASTAIEVNSGIK